MPQADICNRQIITAPIVLNSTNQIILSNNIDFFRHAQSIITISNFYCVPVPILISKIFLFHRFTSVYLNTYWKVVGQFMF